MNVERSVNMIDKSEMEGIHFRSSVSQMYQFFLLENCFVLLIIFR